jgi:hypothetical protein
MFNANNIKYKGNWGDCDIEDENESIKELYMEDTIKNALKKLAIAQMEELANMREKHDFEYMIKKKELLASKPKDAEPKKPKDAEPKKPKDAEPEDAKPKDVESKDMESEDTESEDAEPKKPKNAKPKKSKKPKDTKPKKPKDTKPKKPKDAEPKKPKDAEPKDAEPKKPVSLAKIMRNAEKAQQQQPKTEKYEWQQPKPHQHEWMHHQHAWQQPKPHQPKPQQQQPKPQQQQPKPQQQQPKPQQQQPKPQPIHINGTTEYGTGGNPDAMFTCNFYLLYKLGMGPPCRRHNCSGQHANLLVNGHCIPIGWLPSHYSKNNIIMDTYTDPNGKGDGHKTCIQWFKHTVTGGYECNGTCGCMHECLSFKDKFLVPVGWREIQWSHM